MDLGKLTYHIQYSLWEILLNYLHVQKPWGKLFRPVKQWKLNSPYEGGKEIAVTLMTSHPNIPNPYSEPNLASKHYVWSSFHEIHFNSHCNALWFRLFITVRTRERESKQGNHYLTAAEELRPTLFRPSPSDINPKIPCKCTDKDVWVYISKWWK